MARTTRALNETAERARLLSMQRSAAADPSVLCLAGGLPAPESFPRRCLRRAAAAALTEHARDPLQYDWPEGRPVLRALIARRLRERLGAVEPDDVIVTSGAQDALAIALEVLRPARVVTDRATYPAALDLFRARDGSSCRSHARSSPFSSMRYAMPSLMNPLGRAMTEVERAEACVHDVVVEDDAYVDLRFDGTPPRALAATARDRVVYVGSFSKTVSPGLRVGFVVAPKKLRAAFLDAKARRDLQACGIGQALVEQLLATTDFDARMNRLRVLYRRRWERFAEALSRVAGIRFEEPEGGFSVWVETDVDLSDEAFLTHAIACGVSFDPGSFFLARAKARQPILVRLSYSAIPAPLIGEAVRRFGRAVLTARHIAT
jgi:2-aminoadipate transaminase